MWKEQHELEALRERIARRREHTAVLERLRRQEEVFRGEVEQRSGQLAKEQRDVEKLEKLTIASIFASLRGSKEEDLDRERSEAWAARLRLQEAERQLSEIQEEILDRQARIQADADCEKQYDLLLRGKEAELRKTDKVLAQRLVELEKRGMELTVKRKELEEAAAAGKQVQFSLRCAIEKLEDAEGWGTWDVLGGGLLTDMMKYERIDEAQSLMNRVRSALRRYQAELADVAQEAEFHIRPGQMLEFADYFFDNIFTDYAVLERIGQSKDQLHSIEAQVCQLQSDLEQELAEAAERFSALREEWERLVYQA